MLVSCAIVSITVNPLIFRMIGPVERWMLAKPALGRWLKWTVVGRCRTNLGDSETAESSTASAVVVGLWPGRADPDANSPGFCDQSHCDRPECGYGEAIAFRRHPRDLWRFQQQGDHSAAWIEEAEFLLVTLPDRSDRIPIIATALAAEAGPQGARPRLAISTNARSWNAWVWRPSLTRRLRSPWLWPRLLQQIGVSEEDLQARAATIRGELAMIRPRAEVH